MARLYWASVINGGGTGAMDGIDPTDTDGSATALAAGDAVIVADDDGEVVALYAVRNSAGQSEVYPDIIIPDTNPGNFWFECLLIKFGYEDAVSAVLAYANTPGAF